MKRKEFEERVIRGHGEDLLVFLKARLKRGGAEDLLQEVYLRAYKAWSTYQEKHLRGWLFTIAHNVLKNHRKRESKQADTSLVDVSEKFVSTTPSEDALVAIEEQTQHQKILQDCLANITGQPFAILTFIYSQGLKPAQIGGQLGLSAERVSRIRQAAVERLQRCVAEKGTKP